MTGTVFVDFDGCISICNWRESTLPVNSNNKGYDKFHELLYYDPPNMWLIDMMGEMKSRGLRVVILTGRMEIERVESQKWLDNYCVSHDYMVMRGNDDFRPSEEYKLEYVQRFPKEDVKMIFDDRRKIIDIFRENGYPAFKVKARV